MKKDPFIDIHVLILSLVACFLMTETALFFWKRVTIQDQYLSTALVVVSLVAMALIAVVIYQSLKITETARGLASHMAENMLVYSHELFSELYRSSPVPYVLINESGVVESMNRATGRLFNVGEAGLQNQNILDRITAKDETKTALIRAYYRQGKFISDLEVQILCPDETTKWVLLSLFSFFDGHGVKKGLLTLVDITKQKMIDRAKTEFVSLASHQLRTPISAMKWNMELLETAGKDPMNTVQSAYLKKINHGLARMDLLVRDFLSASKLELGTLTAEIVPTDIVPFLQGVVQEYYEHATQKNIALRADWGNGYGLINTDTHLLHMVLSNLIGNAIKYTSEGGTVTVSTNQSAKTYSIQISDTGIGIPEEDQKMIFSKMFRASNAQTLASDGTGLGLYIVKEVVGILKGTIGFTSQAGVGTTFTIVLQK